MQAYQKEFIDFLVRTGALQFGEFRLKSGRISPYFFNVGQFNRGEEIEHLGYAYASAIEELPERPTIVFGPAYKGIPLCVATAIALKRHFDRDVCYSFDRKEAKDHGEGGWVVGKTPEEGDRLVLVDDVITDGATKVEAITRLRDDLNVGVSALIIALDRKERNASGRNSLEDVEAKTGVGVRAIVTIYDILGYLPDRTVDGRAVLTREDRERIEAYLDEFGLGE
jgi:orotate phosphoribosyltransferase